MEYYTAREAVKRLGISTSSFYRLVSEGKIARLMLPGRRQSFYRREDIESLAETLERVQQPEPGKLALKAYERAELAYSHATGITRYLLLTAESLSNQDVQASIKQLIERTKHIGHMLEELQADVSNLVKQLQEK